MEKKDKRNIIVGLLLFLILINLVALGTIIYQRFSTPEHAQKEWKRDNQDKIENPQERVKLFIKDQLKLNDDQFKEFCRLKDINVKNSGEIWDKMVKCRQANLLELSKENPDTARLNGLSDSVGIFHGAMQSEMNRHFMAVKKILNPDQTKIYNEMILHLEDRDLKRHGDSKSNRNSKHNSK